MHQKSTENAIEDSVHVLNIYLMDSDKYYILTFFSNIRQVIRHLHERCEKIKRVKWYLNLQVELIRETNDEETDTCQPYFESKTNTLLSKDDITDHEVNEAYQKQFQSFDEYIARGSGWTLKRILHMEVYTIQYRPIGGSSYFPLPDALQGSKSIVNIKKPRPKMLSLVSISCTSSSV